MALDSKTDSIREKTEFLLKEDTFLSQLADFADGQRESLVEKGKMIAKGSLRMKTIKQHRSSEAVRSYRDEKALAILNSIHIQEAEHSVKQFAGLLRKISQVHEKIYAEIEGTSWEHSISVLLDHLSSFLLYPFMILKAEMALDDHESLLQLQSLCTHRLEDYTKAMKALLRRRTHIDGASIALSNGIDFISRIIETMGRNPSTVFSAPDEDVEVSLVLRMLERKTGRQLVKVSFAIEVVDDPLGFGSSDRRWYLFSDILVECRIVPSGCSTLRQFDLNTFAVSEDEIAPNALKVSDPIVGHSAVIVFPSEETALEWKTELERLSTSSGVENALSSSSAFVKKISIGMNRFMMSREERNDMVTLRALEKLFDIEMNLVKPGRRLIHTQTLLVEKESKVSERIFHLLTDVLFESVLKNGRLELRKIYSLDDAKVSIIDQGVQLRVMRKGRIVTFLTRTKEEQDHWFNLLCKTLEELKEIRRKQKRDGLAAFVRLASKMQKFTELIHDTFSLPLLQSKAVKEKIVRQSLEQLVHLKDLHVLFLSHLRDAFFICREGNYEVSTFGIVLQEFCGLFTLYIQFVNSFPLFADTLCRRSSETRQICDEAVKELFRRRDSDISLIRSRLLGYVFRARELLEGIVSRDHGLDDAVQMIKRVYFALKQLSELEKSSSKESKRLQMKDVMETDMAHLAPGLPLRELRVRGGFLELQEQEDLKTTSVFRRSLKNVWACQVENSSKLMNGFKIVLRNSASATLFVFAASASKEQSTWLTLLRQKKISPVFLNLREIELKLKTKVRLSSGRVMGTVKETKGMRASSGRKDSVVLVLCSDIVLILEETVFGFNIEFIVPLFSEHEWTIGDNGDLVLKTGGEEVAFEGSGWSDIIKEIEENKKTLTNFNVDPWLQQYFIVKVSEDSLQSMESEILEVEQEVFDEEDEAEEKALAERSMDKYRDEQILELEKASINVQDTMRDALREELAKKMASSKEKRDNDGYDSDSSGLTKTATFRKLNPRKVKTKHAPGYSVDISQLINFFDTAFDEEEEADDVLEEEISP